MLRQITRLTYASFPVFTGPQCQPEVRAWSPVRSFLGIYTALNVHMAFSIFKNISAISKGPSGHLLF